MSMSDEQTVTVWWISDSTQELVEMDVPAHVAEAMDRGQGIVEYGDWPMRRFNLDEAQERLQQRLDEIRGGS
jgi:hypothetical protein